MKREILAGLTVALAVMALAMPTKKELQTAQPVVSGVMSAEVKALKDGTKKPAEVAAYHEELAQKESNEAGKFLLLQGAFKLYVKAGDYEAAAKMIEKLQTEIPDFNPEVTVELCGAESLRAMRENALRHYALKGNMRHAVVSSPEHPVAESVVVAQSAVDTAVSEESVKLEKKVLDLGCKRKLELIPCPAGSFVMGESENPKEGEVRKHKVKITRPFWLSTVVVTKEQWERIMNNGLYDKLDADIPKTNTSIRSKKEFLDVLNKNFAGELPEGYVFRLPTEAEYVYAMTSGGKDKITELSIGVLGPSRAEKEANAKVFGWNRDGTTGIRPTTVGLKKPNTWGFYDVINNGDPIVLDAMALGVPPRKLEMGEKDSVKSISYDDIEVDPLQYDSEGKLLYMSLPQTSLGWRKPIGTWDWIGVFRVCLGPDLVAEKKAARDKVVTETLAVPEALYKGGEKIELSITGDKDVSIGFAACPAGEFMLTKEVPETWSKRLSCDKWRTKHRVKITYPFLIMQGPLSYAVADVLDLETTKKGHAFFTEGSEHIIPDQPVMEVSWPDIQTLAAKMNEKVQLTPSLKRFAGYEFRLPTEAEWYYALQAGADNADCAKVADWVKGWGGYWWGRLPKDKDGKVYQPFAPLSAMKKSKNPWGLFYLGPKTLYADTYPAGDLEAGKNRDLIYVKNDIFLYENEEVNPVRAFRGENSAYHTWYAGSLPKISSPLASRQCCPFRFVFAPKLSLLNVYPKR